MQQWAANNVTQHLNVGRAQDEARRCHRDLAYMMTGDPASPWLEPLGELPRVEDYSPALDRLNEQTLIALALDRRTDLKALMENIQASHELLRSAKNAEQPALDLHLDPEHSFVSFTKKFGNNTARGKEAQAASAEDQAHLAFRQLQDQVHDQVSDALANLRRAASDWAALNDAEKQMGTVVTDAEKRARFGAINWSEYLTAQNQLTQLRQQVINARLAFADNLALLRLVTGSIDPSRPASLAVDMVTLPTP
jgi:outer membrane protein TolC